MHYKFLSARFPKEYSLIKLDNTRLFRDEHEVLRFLKEKFDAQYEEINSDKRSKIDKYKYYDDSSTLYCDMFYAFEDVVLTVTHKRNLSYYYDDISELNEREINRRVPQNGQYIYVVNYLRCPYKPDAFPTFDHEEKFRTKEEVRRYLKEKFAIEYTPVPEEHENYIAPNIVTNTINARKNIIFTIFEEQEQQFHYL